jgi:hypothetical protein
MGVASKDLRRSWARWAVVPVALAVPASLVLAAPTVLDALDDARGGMLRHQDADVVVLSDAARGDVGASALTADQLTAIEFVEGVAEVAPAAVSPVAVLGPGAAGPAGDEGPAGDREPGADGEPAGDRGPGANGDGDAVDALLWGFDEEGPGRPATPAHGRLPERPGEVLAPPEVVSGGVQLGDTLTVPAADGAELEVVGIGDDARLGDRPVLVVTGEGYTELRQAANPAAERVGASAAMVTTERRASPAEVAAAIESAIARTDARPTAAAARAVPDGPVPATLAAVGALAALATTAAAALWFTILVTRERHPTEVLLALGASPRWTLARGLARAALVAFATVGLGTALAAFGARWAGRRWDQPIGLDPADAAVVAVGLAAAIVAAFGPAASRIRRLRPIGAGPHGAGPYGAGLGGRGAP